jgi:hypothetical protein
MERGRQILSAPAPPGLSRTPGRRKSAAALASARAFEPRSQSVTVLPVPPLLPLVGYPTGPRCSLIVSDGHRPAARHRVDTLILVSGTGSNPTQHGSCSDCIVNLGGWGGVLAGACHPSDSDAHNRLVVTGQRLRDRHARQCIPVPRVGHVLALLDHRAIDPAEPRGAREIRDPHVP